MKNGDILRGPRSLSSSAVSAMPDRPPIPEPIRVPVAHLSASASGCQLASSSAWRAAAIAKMMKSSTLRWSFGSIHWSGLKLPLEPSPRGITQAIWLERSATSNVSIFLAPLSPLRIRAHVVSTPQPSGVTMPSPVTTTRLISKTPARNWRPKTRNRGTVQQRSVRLCRTPPGTSAFRVLFEKLRRVADGQNRLGGVIGNFATELFFKCHHKLDGVEAVGAEVVDETCSVNHLVRLDTEMLDNNLLNPLANLTHRSTSCLFHWTRPQDASETLRAIVVVKLPSLSRIVLIRHVGSRQSPGERQALPRQYTGFQNPAMALFAHPSGVRLPYFPSLDYKPSAAPGNGHRPHRPGRQLAQNMAIPPLT